MRFISTILFLVLTVFAFGQRQSPFVPGQILAQVTDNNRIDELVLDLSNINGVETDVKAMKLISKHVSIWQFSFDANAISSRDMLLAFENNRFVEIAQFNHYVTKRETPNDTQFGSQWHHIDGQDNDIDSDLAWDITTGGTTAFGDEIVVCVIEGGNLNHTDLVENKWFNTHEIPDNNIDDDGNGYVDDYDGWNVNNDDDSGVFNGGHGTQVMGMIGAKGNNNLGVSGINWDVKIMSVAGENIGDEASVIAAYEYALTMREQYDATGGALGAFVVATNASWGIDNGDPASIPLWCAFYDTLGEYGILNCGATANNNVNIDVVGDIPTACGSDYMISVTATNSSDVRTFSGYGIATVDLGAPGESVWTTQNSTSYGATSGTSFASPLTAGAIALIYSTPCPSFMALVQADPQAGADYVREVLFNGVDAVANLANECVTGGRLNVNNSIQLIMNSCSSSDCLAPFSIGVTSNNGAYTISWSALAAAQSFNLQYREVGAPTWTTVNNLTNTSYVLSDLVWCSEYEFQLQASCADSDSGWSNLQTFQTEGCCENPDVAAFTTSNITSSTATVTWPAVLAANSYNLVLTPAGGTAQTFNNIINNSYAFTNLTECSVYSLTLQVVCDGETLSFTSPFTFNTVGCGACSDLEFCTVTGNANDEWIESVQLSDMTATTGSNDGYGDFTSNPAFSTVVQAGESYAMTLTPGYSGFQYTEYFKVWLDSNQDGTFADNEVVYDPGSGVNGATNGNVTIPMNAVVGQSRMRVMMKYVGFNGQAPTQCEALEFGETEDYCITVEAPDNVSEVATVNWNLWPNPSQDQITIAGISGNFDVLIFDLSGRMVLTQSARNQTTVAMQHLASGMYTVQTIQNGTPLGTQKLIIE
jgi:hypothetical protein